jgi:hypothetical protein
MVLFSIRPGWGFLKYITLRENNFMMATNIFLYAF